MSISLDFALFMRNSKTKLGLSISARCVALTLAFRMGSNSTSWVSQKTLSRELGISESNVRIHCSKLVESGLLLIKSDGQDKRKNVYSFAKELLNYHAMRDEEKKKYHLKLSDTFGDTAYFQAVNTAQKQAVLLDDDTPETPVASTLNDHDNFPKGKDESKKKKKEREPARKKRVPLSDDFYPNEKSLQLMNETEKRTGTLVKVLLEKFINLQKASGKTSEDWDANFQNFLMAEKQTTRAYQRPHQASEIRSTVPDFGPGHPTWEANKQWERDHAKSQGSEDAGDYPRGTGMRKAAECLLPRNPLVAMPRSGCQTV